MPPIATVMVTALLLTVAMAGGAVPHFGSVGAVQAVLRPAGSAAFSTIRASAATMTGTIPARREVRPTPTRPALSEHDRFLASGPSVPGHGDLPPPTV
jgi:hypothetical protein